MEATGQAVQVLARALHGLLHGRILHGRVRAGILHGRVRENCAPLTAYCSLVVNTQCLLAHS